MPLLPRLTSLIRNRIDRARVERDLDDELEAYVELVTAEKVEAGVEHERARREAWLELGGRESVKERVRERSIGFALDTLVQDLSFGARMLLRRPGFTLLAASTLALGIGATTAVFAVVDGVLLESLPYPDSERIVFVGASARDGRRHFSPPDYVDLRETSRVFDELGALVGASVATLVVDGEPAPADAREVTTTFLSVYGARTHIGRLFTDSDRDFVSFEDQGNPSLTLPTGAAVISHELWRERFDQDPDVVGKLVEVDLQPYRVIGVLQPGFRALIPGAGDYRTEVDLWTLPRMDFRRMPRDVSFLRVVGRLSASATLAQAEDDASRFAAEQRERWALHRESDYRVSVEPLRDAITASERAPIGMLFGAVFVLLLIACANLTNLVLARSLARRRELDTRLALGASRRRLIRQLVTESALFAVAGFVLGAPIAFALVDVFVAMAPATLPRAAEIGVHPAVLGFALLASIVASGLVVLFPALRLTRGWEALTLQASGRGAAAPRHGPWLRVLVVAEVALSVVLVIGTALLLKSLVALLDVEPGFRPERVVTAEMSIASRRYPRYPRADSRVRLVERASEEIRALAGVESVGFALVIPLSQQDAGHSYASRKMTAAAQPIPPAKYRPVTPGYFEAVGTRLLEGRDFTWRELDEFRLVTVVDEKLAEKTWPGESAIGKELRIEVWSTSTGAIQLEPLWTEVIGVAENVRSARLGSVDPETVYLPYGLYAVSELSVLVRSRTDAPALARSLRGAIRKVDGDMTIFNIRTLDDYVADSVASERFTLDLVTAFAALGLFLALIGLYGVLSHLVSLRRAELGLRVALGARAADVRRLVLGRGVRWITAGVAIGLVAASAASRLLASALYQVSPLDWQVYGGVAAIIFVMSLGACLVPARRASKVDPLTTLRLG